MKLLFTIPHFYDPHGDASHQSLGANPQPRIDALTACVTNLHHLFGFEQSALDFARRLTVPANASLRCAIDIVICTVVGRHLLSSLPFAASVYQEHACRCEPKLLGFECHQVLHDRLDHYDYYCYLEDDLILHDPLFFLKLAWFNQRVGNECLLQPNRYETPGKAVGRKLYVDGDLRPQLCDRYRSQRSLPELRLRTLDAAIVFRGALNPHAGSFFLNAAQMHTTGPLSPGLANETRALSVP